jgi:hypothetical protein
MTSYLEDKSPRVSVQYCKINRDHIIIFISLTTATPILEHFFKIINLTLHSGIPEMRPIYFKNLYSRNSMIKFETVFCYRY